MIDVLSGPQHVDFEHEGETYRLAGMEYSDFANILPVVRAWTKRNGDNGHEEVRAIIQRLWRSYYGKTDTKYFVLRGANEIAIGVCGLQEPSPEMVQFQSSPEIRAAEVVDLFIDPEYRRENTFRKKLMNFTFAAAQEAGHQEVLWSAGPRYRPSAWDIYKNAYGDLGMPVGEIPDYHVEGVTTPVWRATLTKE